MKNTVGKEWPRVRIADCCELIVDCVNKTAPTVEGPTPFKMIRTSNVRNGRVDLDNCRYVDEETYLRWTRRATLEKGDVLLTREAPIGEVGYICETDTIFLGQRLMQYRADPNMLDSRFLLYSFLSHDLQHQFGTHDGSGSVVSHIRVGDCFEFKLSLPPLPEQKRIAHILGTLDDKIELNRRMNQTLEQMARALFKSWFVDFDPVYWKLEGKDPCAPVADGGLGLDPATAALFPDKLVPSPLGMIPEGWEVAHLADHTEVTRGLSYKGAGLTDAESGVLMHNLNSVYEGGGYKHEGIKYYSGKFKDKHRAQAGDLIVTNTEQGHKHLLIGYSALVPKRYAGSGLFSHHLYKLAPLADSHITTRYLHYLLLSEKFRFTVTAYTNGTTVNMLSIDGMKFPSFVVPPKLVLALFDSVVRNMLGMKETREQESYTLASIRDALLPRLVQGAIPIICSD